jgi:hypothetical protein
LHLFFFSSTSDIDQGNGTVSFLLKVPADVANGHVDQSSASASAADILAKKLYEEEKRKREERKRKREAEEQWLQLSKDQMSIASYHIYLSPSLIVPAVRKRIEEERKRLEEEERISHQANRELYQVAAIHPRPPCTNRRFSFFFPLSLIVVKLFNDLQGISHEYVFPPPTHPTPPARLPCPFTVSVA